ncbi:PIF1-like helicase [Popillia japonica]|uniref:ATP-dependent DNA helicase n=1 Tax=Popillia japonica TaxID=7064 RepID=A0AAW1LFH0_POPJA
MVAGLSDFGIDDPPEEINMMDDRIDIDEERREANIMVNQLNEGHRNIFDMIIEAINNENEQQRLFYVSGSGRVGKSFLYNSIITHLNTSSIKVRYINSQYRSCHGIAKTRQNCTFTISVISTGVATALLKQGRTVHSRFQLSVPASENSASRITRESEDVGYIREAKLLIWDEVSMTNRLL